MRVPGPTLGELGRRGDEMTRATEAAVRGTLRATVREVGVVDSVDDLAGVTKHWAGRVDAVLLPPVEDAWWHGVDVVREPLVARSKQRALVAAGPPPEPPPVEPDPEVPYLVVPRVSNPLAEEYLAAARNRLVGVGNIVWEHARAALVDGLRAGESTQQLAARVVDSAGLSIPRAAVVSRTEVNGAANLGAIAEVRATGLPASKEWIATDDDRTRPAHHELDEDVVDLDKQFVVDGFFLDSPHDPRASAHLTINCRCTIAFDILDDDVAALVGGVNDPVVATIEPVAGGDALAGAAGPARTGAMVALMPTAEDAKRLELAHVDAEPAGELHLTLVFLGEAADYDADARRVITDRVSDAAGAWVTWTAGMAESDGTITARAFGVNWWNPGGDNPAWVLAVGDDPGSGDAELGRTRDLFGGAVAAGVQQSGVDFPVQHSPWVPHVCVAYSDDTGILNLARDKLGPIIFDRVRLAFGDEILDFPLDGE